jgi:short-subunit dehydrogenase
MELGLRGAVIAITGAARGIGAELAVQLAATGASLALIDRDAAGLEAVRQRIADDVTVSNHVIDLTDRRAIADLPHAVEAAHGRATVLVNNAGVALAGPFEAYGPDDFDWLMEINFWSGVGLTRAFLPLLKAEPVARIVYMSSVFGLIGAAGNVAYCASKFAITGFAEALRQELLHTKVGITRVHPGGVDTCIARGARVAAGVDAGLARERMAKFQKSLRTPPARAAAKIISAIKRGKSRVLIGADAYTIDALSRLAPGSYGGLVGPGFVRLTPGLVETAA